MLILSIRKLSHGFGASPLLDRVDLMVNKGDRVCLLGRNGTGKSTLMNIIAGKIEADSGIIEKAAGLKSSLLEQNFPAKIDKTVHAMITGGNAGLDAHQIQKIISRLNLDGEANFSDLSGGLKRRVLLAKALASEPDILLLDEPTNHLDIESIQWLENFLRQYQGTLILITHDRHLMQAIGNHFVEIDRGKLISWRGDYNGFLNHKEYLLSAEETANNLFDKKLAQEEVWIRQGIKARRTRNEGRVRALKKMRDEYKERRSRPGTVNFSQTTGKSSGKEVFIVDHLSFDYVGKPVIQNFSSIVSRGEKIGILGPNGIGKTTLIDLLLKKMEPCSGHVRHGTSLKVAYHDQHRQQLDEEKSIFDNVCEGSDYIEVDNKQIHIMSYLQNFLFSPDRIRTPVKALSGGERNRIMLAKLFMKPSNIMVLDEPTNDLDIETLELLEEQCIGYGGTLLLVSHDRSFINNIVTATWVFEGNGKIQEYAGGYDDWLLQRKQDRSGQSSKKKQKPIVANVSRPDKLNYKEQRELDQLPGMISKLESELERVHIILADPAFYQKNAELIETTNAELRQIREKLRLAWLRWEALEQLKKK